MAPEAKPQTPGLELPMLVASPMDLDRLLRELAVVDDRLLQLRLRQAGEPTSVPKTSQLLDETVQINQLNLLRETDRQRLRRFLQLVKTQAPVVHLSLSADPSVAFTTKLVAWLRSEVHPQALVGIGLQPTIAAGCILRTTNKRFDFSLRRQFNEARPLLLEKLAVPKVAP